MVNTFITNNANVSPHLPIIIPRSNDILPRSSGEHPGASGPTGQVREQDTDPHQDRSQLENALAIPARRVLHAQGAGRARHVVYGTCVDSTGKLIL